MLVNTFVIASPPLLSNKNLTEQCVKVNLKFILAA